MSLKSQGLLECRLEPIRDLFQVERRWRALEAEADACFFLSWNWIGTWLEHLPATLEPRILSVTDCQREVGLAIVIDRHIRRHGVVRSRAAFINQTGDAAIDEITIEYNGVLALADQYSKVTNAVVSYLLAQGWDEVFIDSVVRGDSFSPSEGSDWSVRCRHTSKGYGVDLSALRRDGKSYLETLSSNTRAQVRRVKRDYEKIGPLTVEAASDGEVAMQWFDRLVDLHQQYWIKKGQPGAFSSEFLLGFHRSLIEQYFPKQGLQVLRVGFGGHWIGYLYNFMYRGKVLNYQTGFDYGVLADRNRPGVAAHHAVIEYQLASGALYYDFLRGKNQNKLTLSTVQIDFDDLVAQRRCVKFFAENCLRAAKTLMSSRLGVRV